MNIKMAVENQMSEFIKIYNLSLKYYIMQLRGIPKFAKKEVEERLKNNLEKKIK